MGEAEEPLNDQEVPGPQPEEAVPEEAVPYVNPDAPIRLGHLVQTFNAYQRQHHGYRRFTLSHLFDGGYRVHEVNRRGMHVRQFYVRPDEVPNPLTCRILWTVLGAPRPAEPRQRERAVEDHDPVLNIGAMNNTFRRWQAETGQERRFDLELENDVYTVREIDGARLVELGRITRRALEMVAGAPGGLRCSGMYAICLEQAQARNVPNDNREDIPF